jgi:sensor c-di-GMP phosphodiesterase-like protein
MSYHSNGQIYKRNQLDSLTENVLNTSGKGQVKALLKLADGYRYFRPDTSRVLLQIAQSQAEKANYHWEICEAKFIQSNLDLYQGKKSLKEVIFIKSKCAKWFHENGFQEDALRVRLSRNGHVKNVYGNAQALKYAADYLVQARKFQNPRLIARAWEQINSSKDDLFHSESYPGSNDSLLWYAEKNRGLIEFDE